MREDADESDEEELMLARAISASLETAKAASAPGIEQKLCNLLLITDFNTVWFSITLNYYHLSEV